MRDGRLHDARHTAATVLLLLGVHERAIMSILGWSSTAMVSRYAHVVAPIHGEVASRLDGLLWDRPHSSGGGVRFLRRQSVQSPPRSRPRVPSRTAQKTLDAAVRVELIGSASKRLNGVEQLAIRA